MNIHDRVQEDYERGLLAVRQGRFMAADHFFQRAVLRAYDLNGLEGKIETANHVGHIYLDQGLVRMAARHFARALKLYERSGAVRGALYEDIRARYLSLCGFCLDSVVQGLGIDASGNAPVPRLESQCPQVLRVVRALERDGSLSPGDCDRAARTLNAQGCSTGRGAPWTAAAVLRLCGAGLP
ncbi:hypothetical protein [Desulfocurvus sp. DL9XJH121]